jgi:hypothetical protein
VAEGGGALANELEAIERRNTARAHEALIAEQEIDPAVTRLMGKIAFIDCLQLPSAEVLPKKVKACRALGSYADRRRLFTSVEP